MDENAKLYYNVKELAEMMSLTTRTVSDYIRHGRLRAAKVGGRWAVTPQNLDEFLNGKFQKARHRKKKREED